MTARGAWHPPKRQAIGRMSAERVSVKRDTP